MRFRSYNRETKLAIASMVSIFNNITIFRYDDKDKAVKDSAGKRILYTVPCEYGDANTIVKSIKSKSKVLPYPLIAITRTGESRDVDRVCDIHRGLTISTGVNDLVYNTPNPINIEFTVSIVALYEEDLNQIMANFMPFFNPCIWISMRNPMKPTEVIRNQVTWDGSVNTELPNEISPDELPKYKASFNFKFKTWHWFGEYDTTNFSSKRIEKIYLGGGDHLFYFDGDGNITISSTDKTFILDEDNDGDGKMVTNNIIIKNPDETKILHYNDAGDLVDAEDNVYIYGPKILKPIYNSNKQELHFNDNGEIVDNEGNKYIDELGQLKSTIYDESDNKLLFDPSTGDFVKSNGEIYYQHGNRVNSDEIQNCEVLKPMFGENNKELHLDPTIGAIVDDSGVIYVSPIGEILKPVYDESGIILKPSEEDSNVLTNVTEDYYRLLDPFVLPKIFDSFGNQIAVINPYENKIHDLSENDILINTNGIYGNIPTNSPGISGTFKDGFYVVNANDSIARVEKLINAAKTHDELPEHDDIIIYKDKDPRYSNPENLSINGYLPEEVPLR